MRLVLVDPGFGTERATLTASWVEALSERQTVGRHVSDEETDADIGRLIDSLRTRLGHDRVYRLAPVESEILERAVKRITPVAAANGLTWPDYLPRPARLLIPSELVTAVEQIKMRPERGPYSDGVLESLSFTVIPKDKPQAASRHYITQGGDRYACMSWWCPTWLERFRLFLAPQCAG
jgi:hypothetical protein